MGAQLPAPAADNANVRFFAKLLMPSTQRLLVNPDDYNRTFDPDEVKKAYDAQARDREVQEYVHDTLIGFGPKRPLTLSRLWDDVESLGEYAKRENNPGTHETLICARLGAEFLANFLTQEANKLATSVKPGATKLLSDAFGS